MTPFLLFLRRVRVFQGADYGKAPTVAIREPAAFSETSLVGQRPHTHYGQAVEDAARYQLTVARVEQVAQFEERLIDLALRPRFGHTVVSRRSALQGRDMANPHRLIHRHHQH